MSKPVEVVRQNLSPAELRDIAARTCDERVVLRLLAVALVLEGQPRGVAAQTHGMDRQTLRNWIIRYNQLGVSGLANRPIPGRSTRLSPAQLAELREIVAAGPQGGASGYGRWRSTDLNRVIAERFGVRFHEATVGRILNGMHMALRQQHLDAHAHQQPSAMSDAA
jgi:transposase